MENKKAIIFLLTIATLCLGSCIFVTQSVTAQQQQSKVFVFVINVRGITSYNSDKLAVLFTSQNAVQAKLVDKSKAIIQAGEENSFSPNKMVDTILEFPITSGIKSGDEFQACVLSLGQQYQSIKCNFGVVNPTESGPQKVIIPL
jgi:hypothetical protein